MKFPSQDTGSSASSLPELWERSTRNASGKYPTMTYQQIPLPKECVPTLNLLFLTEFEPLFQTPGTVNRNQWFSSDSVYRKGVLCKQGRGCYTQLCYHKEYMHLGLSRINALCLAALEGQEISKWSLCFLSKKVQKIPYKPHLKLVRWFPLLQFDLQMTTQQNSTKM